MALPNVSFRSYRGKSSADNLRYCDDYSSVKFGSAGYILEDELNEAQWIQAEQKAKSIRSLMCSGFVREPKYITTSKTSTNVSINIQSGDYFSIGGYIVNLQNGKITCTNGDTVYVILRFNSVDVGNDTRLNRITTKRIKPIIEYSTTLPSGVVSYGTDDNYYRFFSRNNIENDSAVDIYAAKLCKVINNGDNVKFYRAEMFQLPISGKIRSTFADNVLPNNESTIGFDNEFKVLLSGETTTKSLPAWHSNAHVNDKDYSVNNGLYADALWNPNTKYYVQIDNGSHIAGSIVTWNENQKIDGLTIDKASSLNPGAKIILTDDVIATPDINFTGESDYILKTSLKIQSSLRANVGTGFTKPLTGEAFYNTFTVNEKGIVTSAKKANNLSELGISEFNLADAKDWNFLRYDEINSKSWIPKNGLISNLDKNFVYSTDDGILDGSVEGQNYSPTGNTRLNYNGFFYASKIFNAVYNDLAELFEKEDINETIEPGDVICCGSNNKFTKSKKENDNTVVGVVSDTYGHLLGGTGNKEKDETEFVPIGLSGRVNVKVVGDIKKGDLLVTSNISGVAKKCENFIPGIVIGKALQDHSGNNIDRISMLILNS